MVKLKGSTIIETIVAVLIISVCFEIALVGISKAFLSENSEEIINANYLAKQEISQLIRENNFSNRNTNFKGYNITSKIDHFKGINNLYLVVVEVEKSGRLIIQKKKLILHDTER